GRFSERLNAILPKNDYWFVGFKNEFRNAAGEADLKNLAGQYPCLFARGSYEHAAINGLEAYLKTNLPGIQVDKTCSTRHEAILTAGVDCDGNLDGRGIVWDESASTIKQEQ
ncbi:MAG: hypothetical protein OQK53_01590, partial [Rhodospirillales bacterium]|nr:hypothetical protein [Rhodospirillales bacterium]